MNEPLSKRLDQLGVTLVEVMVVVAVVGVLAALAVPSMSDIMQRQRIEGAAEVLTAALQNAKAEAIKTNNSVGIVFMPNTIDTDLSTWCYGMQLASTACDCSATTNACAPGSIVKSSDFTGVTAKFDGAKDRTFSSLRGAVTVGGTVVSAATVTFAVGSNQLGVSTSALGRIEICRPTGTTMGSYTDSGACP